MLSPKDKVINGRTYSVTPLSAVKGRSLLVKLGPTLAAGMAALASKDVTAATKIFETLDENLLTYVCDTLAPSTQVTVDGRTDPLNKTGLQDQLFQANYLEMFQWILFCLEVNYSDFLRGLGDQSNAQP